MIVTGGTGALGREVTRWFVEAGARVHVSWIVEEEVARLEEHLGARFAEVRLHRADLTDEAQVRGLVEAAAKDGTPEVLANIAGGFAYAPVEETDLATWERMVGMNATSAFLSIRWTVPLMKRARRGRIVTVASAVAGGAAAANMSAYAASKAAVLTLTRALAQELVSWGITVNAVVPTIIDTPANRKAMPEADHSKWLKPAEIAAVIGWLASEEAGVVTGSAIELSRG